MILQKVHSLCFWALLLGWVLSAQGVQASPASEALLAQGSYRSVTPLATVEIVPLHVSVRNDSVTLHWKILVSGLRVPSNYSHVLVPILAGGQHSISLPRIVISGRKRASYDLRERELNPFQRKPYSVTVYRRHRPIPPIFYSVTFPYSAWMQHCSLELHQVSESALRAVLLSSERLNGNFLGSEVAEKVERNMATRVVEAPVQVAAKQESTPIVSIDPALVPVIAPTKAAPIKATPVPSVSSPAPADDSNCTRIALFLEYPQYPAGFSGINALFSDNATELAKLDRLLLPLLNNPRLRIRRLLVTGYTSPDGIYQDNEQLSKKRAQEFVRYLRTAYPLPASATVRTSWVAEDWDGLRQLLVDTDLPFRNRALSIIDHTGIFEGRERQLMELDNGNLYRTMKRILFPLLRRIELVVETEDKE